ncbi:MAG TPA: divergent polysaccharide deacetylase family protein [Thermoanaerobaculia bacterium]|nr:divergent polysaccharide deacetylase family protein [Thermoanaerobaculia bacterium]
MALVIDDLGRSMEEIETLGRLGIPITYAVLPFESETPEVVAALHRRGEEVLCHLPMQPVHGQNPGPGALLYGMGEEELRKATSAALAAVPGAVGVNNHMGSRLSADEPSMRAVLGVLAHRGLFFLDSRTSSQSVGYRVASALGVPAAERQVFLDSDMRPEAVREQFLLALKTAGKRGSAIAIGHPHPSTLAVLMAEVPQARALGYRFVTVSKLLNRPRPQTAAGTP